MFNISTKRVYVLHGMGRILRYDQKFASFIERTV